MKPVLLPLFLALVVGIATLTPARAGHAQHASEIRPLLVTWTGEFIDPDLRPVSGVFAITLRLFDDAAASDAVWTERRYVSVLDGTYELLLGEHSALPESLRGRTMSLGVSVDGAGEVTRSELRIVPAPPKPGRAETLAGIEITWADLSERAVMAHAARTAEDCATLDGRTLAQIDRYDELLSEIVRARERLDQLRGAALSNQTVTLERVGGAGGNPYQRTCPPGHVVVGIRGGAGALIDSIELVCAPLQ